MDGLKMYCLQQALEFLHREGIEPASTETIKAYSDFFYSYVQTEKDTGQVVPFKPQGVN